MTFKYLKNAAWVILGCFVILITIVVFLDSGITDIFQETQSKHIEVTDSEVIGYKDDQISWKIIGDYIWAGRNKYLFRAENIRSGQLYDDNGVLVVDHIEAEKIKINSRSKILIAEDGIYAKWLRRKGKKEDDTNTKNRSSFNEIYFTSGYFKYFNVSKKAYISDEVEIRQDKTRIFPKGQVVVDHNKNIAYIKKGVYVISDDFELNAEYAEIHIDDCYAYFKGNVKGIRFSKKIDDPEMDQREKDLRAKETILECDSLLYKDKGGKEEIVIEGDIHILQDDKQLKGQYAYYNKDKKQFIIKNKVTLQADHMKWLIDKDKKSMFQNKDMANSIEMGVTVNCYKISFIGDEKELKLVGDVKLIQDDKTLDCHTIIYKDREDTLMLIGGVKVVKDIDDVFSCKQIKINIQDEVFDAKGIFNTVFRVRPREER